VTLDELRNFVRVQMDVDIEELPNSTIDDYLREAYDRTINTETRWPFFETTWPVSNTGGGVTIVIPLDCQTTNIMSLLASPPDSYQAPLAMIDQELAEQQFSWKGTGAVPSYFSIWGGVMYLWPGPSEERVYVLRGFRKPLDWIGDGTNPTAVVDADERLHQLLVHYAIALAYAQQEDEILEDVYMKRWQNLINTQRRAIMQPAYNRPLVLSGGLTGSWYV
jgi:hypothetical protein